MALPADDIDYLLDRRGWYLQQIAATNERISHAAEAGASGSLEEDAGTLARFQNIVATIEHALSVEGIKFDT